jgi:hypothetical protein
MESIVEQLTLELAIAQENHQNYAVHHYLNVAEDLEDLEPSF